MNVRKWHQSEISIAINDESQEFKVWWVSILHIYHSISWWNPGERIFKIGEHLAKLQAKWLTVSNTPFALHFCPQRCWSCKLSWTTCVLRTKTVTNRCYVNRRINVSLLSTNTKLLQTSFDLGYWLTDWRHQWLTDCWLCTAFCCSSFSLLRQFCTVVMIFLYGRCKQLFVSELNNAYFSRHLF